MDAVWEFEISGMESNGGPASLRYPKWAGLYEGNWAAIYTSTVVLDIGLSGRGGIWPEITVLEAEEGNKGLLFD